jgi:hypothetical protein
MERRNALRALGVGAVAAVATPAVLAGTGGAASASIPGGAALTNQGVGMYTDLSVASQMSAFTINPTMVSCAVGTFGVVGMSGPFSMIMYSTRIDSYDANTSTRTITSTGRMRSITMIVAGVVTENLEHDFIAVATDNRGASPDRFDVHFVTPFWTPGLTNPMATASGLRPGWARFGGNVATGLVLLSPTQLGGVNVS